ILLVPIFLYFVLENIPYGTYIAAGIFIVAASTDGLDGYLARKRKEVTNLGKLLDPLADKLLITAALISLVESGVLPAWVAIVIISRELAVTGLRALAAAEGVIIHASPVAKLKTISQIVAIVGLLIDNFPFSLIGFPFTSIAVWVAIVLTIWSGLEYFIRMGKYLSWY
ncbi:MAG TPA: CDP-diacylglycerol--glycerol-3-phosphate 3-phosphatidyltransferase, partial [Firmicutes bacterium]|nr:CDP-diacylglycerol--glycerol-3-phosphate 3-phosphatidyltransferase [Bacillota bacterium]